MTGRCKLLRIALLQVNSGNRKGHIIQNVAFSVRKFQACELSPSRGLQGVIQEPSAFQERGQRPFPRTSFFAKP
jgi:hypothetical protein